MRVLMAACVIVACIVFVARFWPDSSEAKTATNVLAGEATETHQDIQVVTFKPRVKKALKLPKAVQENERQQVTAATRVGPSEAQTEVTAVLDLDTGKTELFQREIAQPWFQWRNHKAFGVYAGVRSDGEQVIRLTARCDLAKTGGITWAAVGMADMARSGVQGFVGIGGEF